MHTRLDDHGIEIKKKFYTVGLGELSRPIDSHSDARGNIVAGLSNIFTGPSREKILNFGFLSKWRILMYFNFFSDGAPPQTSRGSG